MSLTRRTLLALPLAAPAITRAQGVTEIEFYFPVAVGGPITKIVDRYAADFMAAHPDIRVKPIYAGSYVDTLAKAMTAVKAGQGPALAVTLAVDAHSLVDNELIVPLDTLATSVEDRAWLNSFYPAFLRNGQIGGHVWGVPFQRSTIVMYWNKDVFREAGLDPDHAPANWEEMTAFARKTTKREGDRVTRWGIQVPATGFPYWLYQAFAIQAGAELANAAGNRVNYNAPACVEALQYWIDLTRKYGVHPDGIVDWATTPRDFLEGRVAMIWHTTGNLTNIRGNARFPFGVAMLPAHKRRGSPTGGGNFHLFKGASPAQTAASLRFVKWMTSPTRAAQWGIDTGYVATRPDAWTTPEMRAYVADFPAAAVARDQLEYAVPELSTHDNQRVTQVLNDELQAALLGRKSPKQALDDAQANATRLLRPYAR
ncbi:Glycerol-3-phosphate ABC transporter, periplasmic glycerol-3-phosphate-binding protein (TC 3.A.1.1.3) [Rhodovastum atsumiense]|uniref:ABC transporter substrate-binding protein n=1 Tax=Rhodovastum atsumiense TaxID=504468 RepID=A0A5M6IY32_9PROT|nr:ABC transporter substrate-binding protein [Rhodovastum atsumiense]KAA5613253.1 ABC transporter substrate-binding protein [Rhodovastum atsumiense]CAH2600588.1 Glycerol-3-phosphate ABC transporter, periplasmic glycerol-3-phosphate-binding protein (TC 3.A.1.1.3) [Rhodovastum atsumiense]